MNKYLMLVIVAFSFMATTVHALNDNGSNDNFVNEPITYNQNCPYHNNNEDCPYYNEPAGKHNCPNGKNGSCQHNYGGNRNGCGRQSGCPHHN